MHILLLKSLPIVLSVSLLSACSSSGSNETTDLGTQNVAADIVNDGSNNTDLNNGNVVTDNDNDDIENTQNTDLDGENTVVVADTSVANTIDPNDEDDDDVINEVDNCPVTSNADQIDSDNNGVGDACENNADTENTDSDSENNVAGIGDATVLDEDGDGINNEFDNCPITNNADQIDSDNNSVGDACENNADTENTDSVSENNVAVIGDATVLDEDGDGINNEFDNCPITSNADQVDSDFNDVGDACENSSNTENTDLDNENNVAGIGDAIELDEDGDDIIDEVDNCPLTINVDQIDSDNNGVGDACENNSPRISDIDYFVEVALNAEFISEANNVHKWTSDIFYVVQGNPTTEIREEVDRVATELNALLDVSLTEVFNDEDANLVIFFGSAEDYVNIIPSAADLIDSNDGLVGALWNDNFEIEFGSVYVNTATLDDLQVQKHLIREEFTQAMGIFNDSFSYPDSVFFAGFSTTTEYAPIDIEVIELLYNPSIRAGMTEAEVLSVLGID